MPHCTASMAAESGPYSVALLCGQTGSIQINERAAVLNVGQRRSEGSIHLVGAAVELDACVCS